MDQYTAKIITDILHFLKTESWKAYVYFIHTQHIPVETCHLHFRELSCAFRLSPL